MHRGVRARCDGMGVAWVVCRDSGVPHIPPAPAAVPGDAQELESSPLFGLCACVSHVPPQNLTYLLNPSPLPPSFLSHNPSGALTRGVVDVWSCGPGEARGAGEGRHLISVCPGACLEPHLISAPPFLRTDIRLEHPHQPRPKERERDLSRLSFGACAGVRFQGLNHN